MSQASPKQAAAARTRKTYASKSDVPAAASRSSSSKVKAGRLQDQPAAVQPLPTRVKQVRPSPHTRHVQTLSWMCGCTTCKAWKSRRSSSSKVCPTGCRHMCCPQGITLLPESHQYVMFCFVCWPVQVPAVLVLDVTSPDLPKVRLEHKAHLTLNDFDKIVLQEVSRSATAGSTAE